MSDQASSTSQPPAATEDPRAGALEIDVARERARETMFGRAEMRHTVGRYVLLAPIGRGGMGTVFAAYDPQLDRRVAIKVMRPRASDPARTEALRARMVAEARAMAKVSHPNVIPIYESGTLDDDGAAVWIAMELVDGVTLRRWLAEQPRGWREVVAVHVAAGRGLAAVHDAGLVHRDFKGDNAMIDRSGHVRLVDFGLARDGEATPSVDGSASTTMATKSAGTPGYMPPEQVDGDALDHRADQFALCVSLYESLWGRRPFARDAATPLDPPRSAVPARIRRAILRGLAPDRDHRHPSIGALLVELEPPRRRGVAVAVGVALASSLGLATVMLRPTPCEDEVAVLDVDGLAGIEQAFVATGLGYAKDASDRAVAGLRDYEIAWSTERHRACVATRVDGAQSEARLDRRMRCLERRRRELIAVAQRLTTADATAVDLANGVVDGLTPPSRCDDDRVLDADPATLVDPALASAVDALELELAGAVAALELGDSEGAASIADRVAARAKEIGFAPLVATAEVTRARARWQTGELASTELRAGYFAARAARQPEAAAIAALELATALASREGRFDEARLWLDLGTAEHAALGIELPEAPELDVAGTIAEASGAWEDAIAIYEKRLVRLRESCADGCDELGVTHRSLAGVLAGLGRMDAAVSHARAAVTDELTHHDPAHPHVADARMMLGQVLVDVGRADEGVLELRAAVAALEARFGADNELVATARALLGRALAEGGHPEEGIGHLEYAVHAATQRPTSVQLGALYHTLGIAYREGGRLDDAAASFRSAIEVNEKMFPDGHPNIAISVSQLADVDLALGRVDAALAGYERALALRRAAVPGDDAMQIGMLADIGRALDKLGRGAEALPYFAEATKRCALLDGEARESAGCARIERWRAAVRTSAASR